MTAENNTEKTITSAFLMNDVQNTSAYLDEMAKDWADCNKTKDVAENKTHALLAKCLRFYDLMSGDGDAAKQLRADFEKHVQDNKKTYKFKADTHYLLKIAGVVFKKNDGTYDRRVASAYGKVLVAAANANVTPTNIVTFIKDKGGIAALQKNGGNGKKSLSDSEKAEAVHASLEGKTIGAFVPDGAVAVADRAYIDKPVVLLATQRPNLRFEIYDIVKTAAVVERAFASKYGEQAVSTTSTASNAAAEKAAAVEEVIAEALA